MTDAPEPRDLAAAPPTRPRTPARGVDGIGWLYGVALLVLAFAVARLWVMPPSGPPGGAAAVLTGQLRALEGRVAALEQRPDAAPSADLAALRGRLDALEARLSAAPSAGAPTAGQPASETAELAAALRQDAARLTQLARVQAAQLALEQGSPLGDWPQAPPALARYATSPPPTDAMLRLSFDATARQAVADSRPVPPADASVWQRALARIEALVTVRQGERVLLGDPASGVIAQARHALDAGDLAGAADRLGGLPGPAAAAFAGWVAQARGLLQARAALAALAAGN